MCPATLLAKLAFSLFAPHAMLHSHSALALTYVSQWLEFFKHKV
jgi:hypothetical protein